MSRPARRAAALSLLLAHAEPGAAEEAPPPDPPAAEPGAECYVPRRPFCLAGSGSFDSASEASLCRSATLDYARLMRALAECDPAIAGEAIERATDATAKLRCKERGLRPCF